MNSKHLSNGKFASKRAGKSQVKVAVWIIVFMVTFVGYGVILKNEDKTSHTGKQTANNGIQMIEVVRESNTPEAIEEMKREVVQKLKDGESAGLANTDDKMLMTFDPIRSERAKCARIGGRLGDNCLSFGSYQLKLATVKLWEKKLNGVMMTDKDAMTLALDDKKSAQLVERVIFEIPHSIWAWSSAVQHHDWFNARISEIRKLENS